MTSGRSLQDDLIEQLLRPHTSLFEAIVCVYIKPTLNNKSLLAEIHTESTTGTPNTH